MRRSGLVPALALVALGLLAGPALAQAPDTSRTPFSADRARDVRAGGPVTGDSARVTPSGIRTIGGDTAVARPRTRFLAPRWVMLRSLVVPGWGQATNGAWVKAVLLGGGEAALIAGVAADARSVRDLDARVRAARLGGSLTELNAAIDAYNVRLERLTARQWLLGGVLVYALVDAYVDAHFRDFKIEFEQDPARPGAAIGGARLSLGWAF